MESELNKQQNKIQTQNNNEISEKDIVIHSMPKVFSSAFSLTKTDNGSKGVGLLILVGGVLILVAVLGFFYYFLTRENTAAIDNLTLTNIAPKVNNIKNSEINTKSSVSAEKTEQQKEDEKIQEEEKVEEAIKEATSTPEAKELITDEKENATSTDLEKTVEEATSSIPVIKTPQKVIDSDNDGLSDIEEVLLGTNANLVDSDSDTYTDMMELLGLYNPAGQGSLLLNPNISKYRNDKYGYSVYYSSFWPIEMVGGDESVMFKLNNNQFINMIVENNDEKLAIQDWYKKQFNNVIIRPEQIIIKKGWTGIKSLDGLIAYLMHPASDKIFVLSYNLGLENTQNYKSIFRMIIESLTLE